MAERETFLPMEESEMYRWATNRASISLESPESLKEHIKQLQALLAREKRISAEIRREREALRDRLMQIFLIADG